MSDNDLLRQIAIIVMAGVLWIALVWGGVVLCEKLVSMAKTCSAKIALLVVIFIVGFGLLILGERV